MAKTSARHLQSLPHLCIFLAVDWSNMAGRSGSDSHVNFRKNQTPFDAQCSAQTLQIKCMVKNLSITKFIEKTIHF